MFRIILFTIITLTVLATTISSLNAEPYRQFGEDGAYYWSRASVHFHGMFPLNDGRQVLRSWSSNQIEDGDRQIYIQIVNGDGSTVYDNPLQLSDNDLFVASNGATGIDTEGNIYIAWFSVHRDDSTTALLFVQKFNSEGEIQWGQQAQDIDECGFAPKANNVLAGAGNVDEIVVPDEEGGCYYITRNGLFAINFDGELRDDWDWHYEQLMAELTITSAKPDEAGGFWCSVFGRTDDEQRLDISGLNHYNYDGERLWDEYQAPVVENLPEGHYISRGHFYMPIENGIICRYWDQQEYGLCILDNDWSLRGEEFIHPISNRPDPIKYLKLQNGNILFHYAIRSNDFSSSNVNIYDSESNELLWGNEGILLRDEDQQYLYMMSYSEMVETTDGNLIIPVGLTGDPYWCEVFGLSSDGELLWDEPVVIDNMGKPLYMTAVPDGGFWLAGERLNSLRPVPPFSLNRYSEDGEPVQDGNMEIGVPVRSLGASHVWLDQDGNYKIFGKSYRSFKIQTLDDQGNIIGDPNGENLIEFENEQYEYSTMPHRVAQAENNILVCWRNDITDEPNPLELTALDLNGDIQWTMDVIEQSDRDYPRELIPSPDGNHTTIVIDHYFSDSIWYTNPVLYWIDLESQEVEWNVSFENSEMLRIVFADEFIYVIRDENEENVYVDKFDLNGQPIWEEPFLTRWQYDSWEDDVSLFGTAISDDDCVLLAYSRSSYVNNEEYDAFVWIEKVDPDGEGITDSLSFYSEPLQGNIRQREFEFDLIISNNNIWAVPLRDIHFFRENLLILPIQGITIEGDRIIGEDGFTLDTPEGHLDRHFIGNADGVGGLWISWERINLIDYSQKSFALHFEANGDLSEGWDSDGVEIFGNYFREYISPIAAADNNGLLVCMGGDQNHHNYHLQHLMVHHPADVKQADKALPEEFRIESIHPNPLNSQTSISYHLPTETHLDLGLYDISGRQVMTLFSGVRPAGVWSMIVDGSELTSGLYFVRLNSTEQRVSQKLVLVR